MLFFWVYVKIILGDYFMVKNNVKTITLKVSDNTKDKMVEYFADKKREKNPPYAVFQAKEADSVITLYESGKCVFQGISADIDANMWAQMERHLNPDKEISMKKADSKNNKTKNYIDSKLYNCNSIGSDEVGTGDYFGPIVVSAAYVTKSDISFLEGLGVKDSKKLSDEQILKIVPEIIKKIPYSSMVFSNKEYNEKYSSDINMNTIKAILHNKVLLEMTSKYSDYDYVVVDQFAKSFVYYNYLKKVSKVQRNITFVTKAEDKCLSVACASLISRYIFIKEFDALSKRIGMVLPKGAGNNVDEAGAKLVKKYGNDILLEISKYNFKNTEKIKELL